MSVQENKDLIRRYVEEVYNQQDLDLAMDYVGGELKEAGTDHLKQFFTAFPDSQTTLLDLFGEDDKVVARLLIRGTNQGPFAGQPPTGREVEFISFRIYRIEDQKIVETWAMQDRMGLMEQLGFVKMVGDVNWADGEED